MKFKEGGLSIKNRLKYILNNKVDGFKLEEIDFMIENIGTVDYELRDSIIYSLFYKGFNEKLFTYEEAKYIVREVLENDKLFLNIGEGENDSVFTRSFTSLLYAILVEYDNEGNYKDMLSRSEREKLFNQAVIYLNRERDFRGYVEDKGWAHGIAHGSDLMSNVVGHREFNQENIDNVLDTIARIILLEKEPFIDDEEERLGFVIVNLIIFGRLETEAFINWIEKIDVEIERKDRASLEYYYIQHTFKVFLQAIYFKLMKEDKLKLEVKEEIDRIILKRTW